MGVRCSRTGIEGLGSDRERTPPWEREGAEVLLSEMKNYSPIGQMTKQNLSVVAQGWLVHSCRLSKCGSRQGSSRSWASGKRRLGWLDTRPSSQLVKGHESTWMDSLLLGHSWQQSSLLTVVLLTLSSHDGDARWVCHMLRSESLRRSLSLGVSQSSTECPVFPSVERHSLWRRRVQDYSQQTHPDSYPC